MFSIPYIIAQLYPKRTMEDQQKLVDHCFELERYYEDLWDVKKEDLVNLDVQLRLVRTLFDSQTDEAGVVLTIMDSLEEWSKDGTLLFPDLPEEAQFFYEHYYGFIGFMHFDSLGMGHQSYLLRSRFLWLACIWDVPVYSNVQHYFEQFVSVPSMKDDARMFAASIGANDMPVGVEGKAVHTIGEWTTLFNTYVGTTSLEHFERKVDDFMDANMEAGRMDDDTKLMLNTILTLYYGLRTGFIWREIKDEVPAGYERKETKDIKTQDQYYLELLSGLDAPRFDAWLADWQETATWLIAGGKERDFMNQFFFALTQKLDLANEKQTSYFVELVNALQQNGWSLGGDLLYFNEQEGKFHWNEDMVAALRDEVADIQSKPQKEASPPQKISLAENPT